MLWACHRACERRRTWVSSSSCLARAACSQLLAALSSARLIDTENPYMVSGSNFEWDPAKAAINLRKHRVAFEDAISIFYDDWAVIEDDPDPDEVRFRIIGTTARGMLLVVVYTERGND